MLKAKLQSKDKKMVVNFYQNKDEYEIQYVFDCFIGNKNFSTDRVSKEEGNNIYMDMRKEGYVCIR